MFPHVTTTHGSSHRGANLAVLRRCAQPLALAVVAFVGACTNSRPATQAERFARGNGPVVPISSAPVEAPAPRIDPSPTPGAPIAELAAADGACTTRARVRTVLGDDARESEAVWTRCGPTEPDWGGPGGEPRWPHDRVTLATPDGAALVLFDNAGEESLAGVEALEPLALEATGAQLFLDVHAYGTGNIHDWRVLDRKRGALREWQVDDYDTRWRALLNRDESVGKQFERGVTFGQQTARVTHLIYRKGEPNCCPTGGFAHAELVPDDGRFRVKRVWRERTR